MKKIYSINESEEDEFEGSEVDSGAEENGRDMGAEGEEIEECLKVEQENGPGNKWSNYMPQLLSYDRATKDSWVIVDYEGEYFIGLVIKHHDQTKTVRVSCLNLPFGIAITQDREKDEIAADFPEDKLFAANQKETKRNPGWTCVQVYVLNSKTGAFRIFKLK